MLALGTYIMYDIFDVVIVWYILSHAITALYYRLLGATHWWIALLPMGTTIVIQMDLCYMPARWSVFHTILVSLTLFMPLPTFIVYRLFILLRDCLYSLSVSECEWYKWGCIPLYRYVYMIRYIIREVKNNASNSTG